ncbi:MAG: excinuclease ABC subunit UvrB [Cytophagales bacterium]|nr:excinuclease ABC subunit UvrB [Cytophagales bacterium]
MLMDFDLHSDFQPKGDQPKAIEALVKGLENGEPFQTLLGVTGSGKTFTMANVIKEVNRPTLILSHNKTLAAQLYGEFKQFFPNNAVEYFVSYYDYYQPEAYLPTTDVYIEKELMVNAEIEKLRLSATSSLMSGRNDVIVISSVSCIYGMGNPEDFQKGIINLEVGQEIPRSELLFSLVDILYNRTEGDFIQGTFRVKGDTLDIFPAYTDFAYRIYFWGDEIEEIHRIDPVEGTKIASEEIISLSPANLFVTAKDTLKTCISQIQDDLVKQVKFFEAEGKFAEAKRLLERTEHDLEMMRELGYCSGIENYSRYFDGRAIGARPFCLLDYFPKDFIVMMDESHVTKPQIGAMYGGDRARKVNLVEYGFRLPAAMDNRPLKFEEFEGLLNQVLFVSATPADYELEQSEGVVVEQLIRPTGLLDPEIDVRPTENQIEDLLEEVQLRIERDERVLITTLTKRMAEELSKYLDNLNVKTKYIHSDIKVLERVEILRDLRLGEFDVLVGVNLLREGLDLPEVSLVVIFDADKEGFLRNYKSMIQTIGRAARNANGYVVMYADKETKSMKLAIDETKRRRAIQMAYNEEHGIIPKTVKKSKEAILGQTKVADKNEPKEFSYKQGTEEAMVADPVISYMSKDDLQKMADSVKQKMENAAKELDFIQAAQFRDELSALQERIGKM